MKAVFEVIKNRAKSNNINLIHNEARRPKQFSCLNNISDSNAIARARKSVMWPVAVKIVKSNQNTNLTNGARHYYADWLKPIPSWAKKVKSKKKIGHHVFVLL